MGDIVIDIASAGATSEPIESIVKETKGMTSLLIGNCNNTSPLRGSFASAANGIVASLFLAKEAQVDQDTGSGIGIVSNIRNTTISFEQARESGYSKRVFLIVRFGKVLANTTTSGVTMTIIPDSF